MRKLFYLVVLAGCWPRISGWDHSLAMYPETALVGSVSVFEPVGIGAGDAEASLDFWWLVPPEADSPVPANWAGCEVLEPDEEYLVPWNGGNHGLTNLALDSSFDGTAPIDVPYDDEAERFHLEGVDATGWAGTTWDVPYANTTFSVPTAFTVPEPLEYSSFEADRNVPYDDIVVTWDRFDSEWIELTDNIQEAIETVKVQIVLESRTLGAVTAISCRVDPADGSVTVPVDLLESWSDADYVWLYVARYRQQVSYIVGSDGDSMLSRVWASWWREQVGYPMH